MATLPGFKYLGGKTQRYLNEITGESISRRQYDKLTGKLSYEALAKINKAKNFSEQLARPARGRNSLAKLTPEFRASVVEARLEKELELDAAKKQRKITGSIQNRINRATARKVRSPKFSPRLLKAGRQGRRLPFLSYSQYVTYFDDAKKSGIVFAYALGINAIDTRDAKEKSSTVFTLRSFDRPISEQDFMGAMNTFMLEKSYFAFLNYFIHFAFKKEYAKQKAIKAGIKWVDKYHVAP